MKKSDAFGTGFGFALILTGTAICVASLNGMASSTTSLALALPGLALGGTGVAVIGYSRETNLTIPTKHNKPRMFADCAHIENSVASNGTHDCRDFVHHNKAWDHVSEWTKKAHKLSRERWPPRYP